MNLLQAGFSRVNITPALGTEIVGYFHPRYAEGVLDELEINALALRRAGVCHIEISRDCTMCQPQRFWSHRYTRGLRGSQGAIIVCKEVQP